MSIWIKINWRKWKLWRWMGERCAINVYQHVFYWDLPVWSSSSLLTKSDSLSAWYKTINICTRVKADMVRLENKSYLTNNKFATIMHNFSSSIPSSKPNSRSGNDGSQQHRALWKINTINNTLKCINTSLL